MSEERPTTPLAECLNAIDNARYVFETNAAQLHMPPGTEASEGNLRRALALAATKLEEAQMWANAAAELYAFSERATKETG